MNYIIKIMKFKYKIKKSLYVGKYVQFVKYNIKNFINNI